MSSQYSRSFKHVIPDTHEKALSQPAIASTDTNNTKSSSLPNIVASRLVPLMEATLSVN